MTTVLITGATGFIGSHLVQACLRKKYAVRILCRPGNAKAKDFTRQGVTVISGDIQDAAAVDQAVSDVDLVFHLAAVVTDWAPRTLFDTVNVEGTRNVCEAALKHKVKRLVEMSTNDVLGQDESQVIDETHSYSVWNEPYPDTKIQAANLVWEYAKKGLPVTLAYPCWVYGPGDKTFVPLLADAIYKGELIFWRKQTQVWPVYVDNLIDLLLVLAEHPKAIGQGFLVHDDESVSFQAFSQKLALAIGAKAPTVHIPYAAAYGLAWCMEVIWKLFGIKTRPLLTTYTIRNLGSNLRFSIQKAQDLLGWKPPVSFQTGFARTMDWLKQTQPDQWKQK